MLRHILIFGFLAAASANYVRADDKHNHALPTPATNDAFEKLKSLVGNWVKIGDDGLPTAEVQSVIKLTAGGSAIQETIFPGTPMEMVSIYTPEGKDVVLTHYCVLGNQPRMKATAGPDVKQLKFEFVGGGNLDPAKDKHMHGATLTFDDADHITIDGVAWENGAPSKEMCGQTKLARKK